MNPSGSRLSIAGSSRRGAILGVLRVSVGPLGVGPLGVGAFRAGASRAVAFGVGALMVMTLPALVSANERGGELIRTGMTDVSFRAVAVSPTTPERVLAATRRALYESTDDGQAWHARFHLPRGATATGIAIEPAEHPAILLATDRGLFGSFDGGTRWSRVFRGIGKAAAACTYVAFHPAQPGTVLLGTHDGLWMSVDRGQHWKQAATPPAARHVEQFAFDPQDPDRLYLLTTHALFVGSLKDGGWQRRLGVFRTHDAFHAEEMGVEGLLEANETAEAEVPLHLLSTIAVDPHTPSILYVGTSRGLKRSEDRGITWTGLPRTGLTVQAITRLVVQAHSPAVVYAATRRGVARYDPHRRAWTTVTTGLASSRVHDLAASANHLWAATDRGLFRHETSDIFPETEPPSVRELLSNFVHEPTIAQVQDAAIRYAEVHPDKIRRWRRRAALKALLPTVTLGMDRDTSRDIRVDEGRFPEFQLIETNDRDVDLDVSVKWDIGELIWNHDQTTIDVRSKLMVQLRDDIVDEVTRTYFERRRVQVTLLTDVPRDRRALLEQELRLQELTALIDGLTGGYFTQQLRINNH